MTHDSLGDSVGMGNTAGQIRPTLIDSFCSSGAQMLIHLVPKNFGFWV